MSRRARAHTAAEGKHIETHRALAAFGLRSFRYQFSADLLTAWAIEMEVLVLAWYILVQTDSAFMVALVGVARFGGTLLTPLFGTLADRLPRKRMLIAIRAGFAALAGCLAALALTEMLVPWHAFAVAAASGLLRPADMMLRQSLIGDTVPGPILVSAMGYARTTLDSARIFGALAGASLMAWLGIGTTYVAVALFYGASAGLSLGIGRALESQRPADPSRYRPAGHAGHATFRQAFTDLADGVRYVAAVPRIHALLWVAFLVNLAGLCITGGLLPIVARQIYGFEEIGLGALIATFAAGALIGSLLIATVVRTRRPDQLILNSTVAWHVVLVGFSLVPDPHIGIPLLGLVGLLSSLCMVPLASTLIAATDSEFRGRVMGLRQLAVIGLPIGLLAGGAMIEVWGVAPALVTISLTGLAIALVLTWAWPRIEEATRRRSA